MKARFVYLFLFMLLAGCSKPPTQPTSFLQANTLPVPTVPQNLPDPSPTLPAIDTQTPVVLDTSIPIGETPVEVFRMCSPLKIETIPELFDIVSDPYNPPPVNRSEERHHGVDFSHYSRKGLKTIEFEPVQSILPGIVAAVVHDRLPYGNMLIVETSITSFPPEFAQVIGLEPDKSLYVLYAHFTDAPQVEIGDFVDCGQILGAVGKTGYNIVNPHLHLETRFGPPGEVLPGMAFYTTTASQEEMESYRRWRTSGEFQHINPMEIFFKYIEWADISN